ncbi:hypothetical protein HUT18_17810 [Streptomyces sp. NA04227]|uniref:hypothetical protein n=1 Tax=Streptomyces sp. NA04227 TaxID=2742136 RepID=UPI0015925F59|nr:hypothetical protein [Streptomyces sp. NA04227]QKW07968.1 hypothetical protein HUT18_17810 [Streptomyces sp. NA04227]
MIETLAVDGGREFVRALAAGFADLLVRAPALWRRSGPEAEGRMAAELERYAGELADADEDGAAVTRAELVWETRLRDLLAAHPEAQTELAEIIEAIRQERPPVQSVRQNITASGQNSTAQGVIGGNIVNHGPYGPPSLGEPAHAPGAGRDEPAPPESALRPPEPSAREEGSR